MTALWDQLARIPSQGPRDDDSSYDNSGAGGRCSLCRSRRLHTLLDVSHEKDSCPLKGVVQKKARVGAKDFMENWDKNPSDKGPKVAIQEKVKELKKPD